MDHTTMPADQYNQDKNIYEASYGEIFWKNFVAGLGRAVGGLFIHAIFVLIAAYVYLTYVWPSVKPFIDEYRQAMQGINKLNTMTTRPGTGPDSKQYQQFLRDLQDSLPR